MIVLGLSKTATCILYDMLFSQTNCQFIRVILVGTFAWTLISVVLLSIRCGKDPWSDISSSCHHLVRNGESIRNSNMSSNEVHFSFPYGY